MTAKLKTYRANALPATLPRKTQDRIGTLVQRREAVEDMLFERLSLLGAMRANRLIDYVRMAAVPSRTVPKDVLMRALERLARAGRVFMRTAPDGDIIYAAVGARPPVMSSRLQRLQIVRSVLVAHPTITDVFKLWMSCRARLRTENASTDIPFMVFRADLRVLTAGTSRLSQPARTHHR